MSFFALAAYTIAEATRDLVDADHAGTSLVGVVLATVSLLVMPALAVAKRRTGRQLGNKVVVADSTETALCSYLSVILLAGLVLNATVGWWWADPLAALGIATLALREGREAWRGDGPLGSRLPGPSPGSPSHVRPRRTGSDPRKCSR